MKEKKKILSVVAVIALIIAGSLLISCGPSDSDPEDEFDADMTFEGGKYIYEFTSPKIEDGKIYEVILTIEKCSEAFYGSQLGGKICYEKDDKEEVLSGWSNPTPGAVSKSITTYRWTFEAGEQYKDSVTPVTPATTPDGAVQYFSLTAQDSTWNDYPASVSFEIKGEFVVREKTAPTGDPKKIADITTTGGSEADATTGKGNIESDDFDALSAASEDAFLRFYITCTVVASGSPQRGYGIACIGNLDKEGETNPNTMIKVPENAEIKTDSEFTVDVLVADALICRKANTENWLFVNVWDGKITKTELWDYE